MMNNHLLRFFTRQKYGQKGTTVLLPLAIFGILTVAGLVVRAQDERQARGRAGTITGCVKVFGAPKAGIELALVKETYEPKEKAIALTNTDERGCYQLNDVPPGYYWLKVLAPEYIGADLKNPARNVRRVSVRDRDSVEDVNLDLVVGGAISGRVTDEDGNPIAGEYLSLTYIPEYDSQISDRLQSYKVGFKTNTDGTYKILGVSPGRYLVSVGEDIDRLSGKVYYKNDWFGAQGSVRGSHYYEQIFYPGVTKKTDARVIEVAPGAEFQDVNITVGQTIKSFSVSGRVIEAETGKPIGNHHLQIVHRFPNGGSQAVIPGEIADHKTDEDGFFRISGFIPGKFSVSTYFEGDSPLYLKAVVFEIKDKDVEGLELVARRGLSVTGSVQIEDGDKTTASKLSELKLHLYWIRGANSSEFVSRETHVNQDGSFTINGLFVGQAEFSVWSRHFDLKRVEYSTPQEKVVVSPTDRDNKITLPLANADLKNLRVVVAYKGGNIKGQVKIIGGKPNSTLVLEASISRKIGQGGWSTSRTVDLNGYFSIDGLEEGEYDIYIQGEYNTGVFPEQKTVKVKKNSEATVVFTIDPGKIEKPGSTPRR